MVLEAVVAGSIVAGTGVGIVFKIKSWLRDEKERRIEAEERREARQQAREERLRDEIREMGKSLGSKMDDVCARVARLEGEFRSFRDFMCPIVRSLARPDRGARGAGAASGGGQPAAGPGSGALQAGE